MTAIASLTALVLGGLCAWWAAPKAAKTSHYEASQPNQLARLEQRFLHVRDATMQLNETVLQLEKLHDNSSPWRN